MQHHILQSFQFFSTTDFWYSPNCFHTLMSHCTRTLYLSVASLKLESYHYRLEHVNEIPYIRYEKYQLSPTMQSL